MRFTRLHLHPFFLNTHTMPLIHVRNKQISIHQEGRALAAIEALQKESISFITAAAHVYDVPRSTLRNRVNGALRSPPHARTIIN